MRRRVWIGIGVIILLVAAIAFALIGGSDDATTGDSAPPATPVTMVAVVEGDVPIELDALGRVQGANTVTVRAQVAGQIQGAHPGELCGGTSLEPMNSGHATALCSRCCEGLRRIAERSLQRLLDYQMPRRDDYMHTSYVIAEHVRDNSGACTDEGASARPMARSLIRTEGLDGTPARAVRVRCSTPPSLGGLFSI